MKKKALRKQIVYLLVLAMLILPFNGIETMANEKALEQSYMGDGYEVTFQIDSLWNNNYNATVTLKNTGKVKIENWHLAFRLDNSIENIWNAKVESLEEDNYIIKNLGWNQNIEPGSSVSFGFTAKGEFTEHPKSYILLGEVVNADDDEYMVTYRVESQWGVGFNGNVTITNNTEEAIEGWSLAFDFDNEVSNIWNAIISGHKDGRYYISNATYNQNIEPGASISFGFTVADGNVDNRITNPSMQKVVMVEGDSGTAVEDSGTTMEIDTSPFKHNEAGDFYIADSAVDALSGTFTSKEKINSLAYVVKNSSGIVLKEGGIKAENQWRIDGFGLAVGLNDVTITALTDKGKYEKSIVIMNFLPENGNSLDLDMDDGDGDGIPNYFEDYFGTDKDEADTDGDVLSDYDEIFRFRTEPFKADTDDNGTSDGDEDNDGDRMANIEELRLGTDPFNPDTDGDGLGDYDEACIYFSNPLLVDSDSDGLPDALEMEYGMDPTNPDTLGDQTLDGDRTFTFTLDGDESDDGKVKPLLTIDLQGKQIEGLTIDKVSEDDVFLNPDIPGYLGNAFDFNVEGGFSKATLTFEFDKELLNDPAFVPAIYYWDEEAQFLCELPDQSVMGNTVSVELEHFSSYMVLAKNIHDEELFRFEVLPPTDQEMQSKKYDVAFVFDESKSILRSIYASTKELMKGVLDVLGDEDRVAVFTFDDVVRKRTGFVDKDTASSVIDGLDQNYGNSDIYNAINAVNMEFITNSSPDATKIMILFSDGNDKNCDPANTLDSVTKTAVDNNIVIYTVGITWEYYNYDKISRYTGGSHYHYLAELVGIFDRFSGDDRYKDSDNDGLTDYHEKKIAAGEIKMGTGATVDNIKGLRLNYQNPDSDGDGLKDGEELKIGMQYVAGREVYYCSLYSNPCLKDSDEDGVRDADDENPLVAPDSVYFYKVTDNSISDDIEIVNDAKEKGKAKTERVHGAGRENYSMWEKIQIVAQYEEAVIVATVGGFVLPQGGECLMQYLGNTGSELKFNIHEMISYFMFTQQGNKFYHTEIEKVAKFAQNVLKDGDSVTLVSSKAFTSYENDLGLSLTVLNDYNWFVTLGGAQGAMAAKITRHGKLYTISFRYMIFDYYDWNEKDNRSLLPGLSNYNMWRMQDYGIARDYFLYGEIYDMYFWW